MPAPPSCTASASKWPASGSGHLAPVEAFGASGVGCTFPVAHNAHLISAINLNQEHKSPHFHLHCAHPPCVAAQGCFHTVAVPAMSEALNLQLQKAEAMAAESGAGFVNRDFMALLQGANTLAASVHAPHVRHSA